MKFTCSICNKKVNEFPNNAQPINNGICCSECNTKYVIPTRIKQKLEFAGYSLDDLFKKESK